MREAGGSERLVILHLGEPGRPQVEPTWGSAKTGEPLLTLKLVAEEVRRQTVYLRVTSANGRHTFARGEFAPAASGDVVRTLPIVVRPKTTLVCVVASTVPDQKCPPADKMPPDLLAECLRGSKQVGGSQSESERRRTCEESYGTYLRQVTSWVRLRTPGAPP